MAEASRFTQLMDRAIFKPWGDFATKHTALSRIVNPKTIGVAGLVGALTNYASNFFMLDADSALPTILVATAGLLAKGISNRIDNAMLHDKVQKSADAEEAITTLSRQNSNLLGQMERMQKQMIALRGSVMNITHLTVKQKVMDKGTNKETDPKPVEQDYILLEELGVGGFATVRRATNLTMDRTEVMKIAHSQYVGDANFRDRFFDEIDMLMRLEHPNVVKILGYGEMEVEPSRGIKKVVPFYTMEPISGSPLSSILKTMRLELSEKTVELMLRMARTVKYFHEKGIIHRDIKPSNIFITDSEELVKFIDFGIAKDTEEDRNRTRTGELAGGTQEYMPREQFLGQPLDFRADLYALGATFFEMLAGTPPYPAAYKATENRFEKPVEYLTRLLHKEWGDATFSRINLSQLIKDLPKQNQQYIFQSLFKNPQHEQMVLKVDNYQLEAILEEMVTKRFLAHEQRVFFLDGIRRIQYSRIPKIELHLMKGGATPHYKEMLQLLQDIFNKMLHGDKDYRYASDDELISDLEILRGMMRSYDATVAPSRQ